MNQFHPHNFHVPVMGIGYTIDSPMKLAHLGITSVVSLVDDMLMEKMREFHSRKANFQFHGISAKMEDFRAKRITAFLDMMDITVKSKVENMKSSFSRRSDDIDAYFEMLPDASPLKQTYHYLKENASIKEFKHWVISNLHPGQIDVNIMTKLDRENFLGNEQLPVEYNDAHAALRGFAQSKLESSIILSAGMNTRLFGYLEKWDDFYPDQTGKIKKQVIIKVSDYRSAMVQGKMLAKKGIWVSDFRIDSGLNCGGHAFASNGRLLGPILEDFKNNREVLIANQFDVFQKAIEAKERFCPEMAPSLRITAQGGVGTAEEHKFLLKHYQLDSVGWGTPFLLVPEAVSIDNDTMDRLALAGEEDLYLSDISPLGVPFYNLRGNTKDAEKEQYIKEGKPGSKCTKHYCSLNKEFGEKPICTASRNYQQRKIRSVESEISDKYAVEKAVNKITEKSCICVGLGTSALLANGLSTSPEGSGVSVCPGPNMAYFNKKTSLKEMVSHIYGRTNLIERNDRPNMFVKELELYVDYYNKQLHETDEKDERAKAGNRKLLSALQESIAYYRELFTYHHKAFGKSESILLHSLEQVIRKLELDVVNHA
jgi:hypothetical protein